MAVGSHGGRQLLAGLVDQSCGIHISHNNIVFPSLSPDAPWAQIAPDASQMLPERC